MIRERQMQPRMETVDNTPVEMPTRLRLPQTRADQLRQFVRDEMSRAAQSQGMESFEEADDVEPDDGDEYPMSPYEVREFDGDSDAVNGLAPDNPPVSRVAERSGARPADPAAGSPPATPPAASPTPPAPVVP